jgi:hypothetical protein
LNEELPLTESLVKVAIVSPYILLLHTIMQYSLL